MSNPKYKRILLKVSGEALLGTQEFGIDYEPVEMMANEIKSILDEGVEVAVVAVFVALDDVSVFIHLVIHLCLNAGTDEQNHQREQFLHHSIFIIRNTISINLNTIDARMM